MKVRFSISIFSLEVSKGSKPRCPSSSRFSRYDLGSASQAQIRMKISALFEARCVLTGHLVW